MNLKETRRQENKFMPGFSNRNLNFEIQSTTRRKSECLTQHVLDVPLELMAAGLAEGHSEEGALGGGEREIR